MRRGFHRLAGLGFSVAVLLGWPAVRISGASSIAAARIDTARRDLAASTGTLTGNVMDVMGAPLAGVTVRILHTMIPPAQTDGAGAYTIAGIPAGGYDAVFGLLPTYGASADSFTILSGQTTTLEATLPSAESFEGGPGPYTGDYPWQWGTPSGPGPDGAFSGTDCWATNLTGNYPDNTIAYLDIHVLDPTGLPNLSLSFTHYYDTQAGADGGNVQVSNGSGWITVAPAGGYPSPNVTGLGGEAGWSGFSGGWQPAVFDLSPYSHAHLYIRFHFGSDSSVNGPGWYIDDVAIYVYASPTSGAQAAGSRDASIWLLQARPNPFRDASIIRPVLPGGPAMARLRIVDAAGRLVRDLYDGWAGPAERGIRWDGRDLIGHSVPAGTYYCTLEAKGRVVAGSAIVRIR